MRQSRVNGKMRKKRVLYVKNRKHCVPVFLVLEMSFNIFY